MHSLQGVVIFSNGACSEENGRSLRPMFKNIRTEKKQVYTHPEKEKKTTFAMYCTPQQDFQRDELYSNIFL